MLIPAAEYAPDVADLNSSFSNAIQNVLCASGGYIPAPALSALTSALGEQPIGWLSVRSLDGSIRFFAGTPTKLFLLNNTDLTWTNVSKAATVYNASVDVPWHMKAFGNFIIAVNQNDDPQVYQIGTDVLFRNLGGSPPRAGRIAIWGDFVALLDLTSNQNRVQWSGLNNCEFWTPGSNNSDYQDFPDGGRVTGSSDVTNPIVLLESAIQRATFVPGSAEIFTFQKVQEMRGAKSPLSVATRGSFVFFADAGGFFQCAADGSVSPIGFEKVDRTVFGKISVYGTSKIMGAIDPFYSRVYWAVDTNDDNRYEEMYVYDWQLQKWTMISINVMGIFPFATSGYTLDGLDSVSSSLDALPFSLDSKVWDGGAPVLGSFTSDWKIGAFSGTNLEATITTQEMGDTAGQVTRAVESAPVVDTINTFVSIGVRMRRSDNVVWLPEQIPSTNTGVVKKRARARFMRFKTRIPAGVVWRNFKGIDVPTTPAGSR
ncbi:hypothetical protein V6R85_01460 [Agrobacterium sp. CCNWLW32]|uniref:hypothetical protein n=1 Tax=Agrobacterium sp. CCNWLW32 TaxID=3122072 RepID=UPI00300FF6B2